jgi:hypothetical protein
LLQFPEHVYVDDAKAMQQQIQGMLPSVQRVIADIAHVMRRISETLTPRHGKAGKSQARNCKSLGQWVSFAISSFSCTSAAYKIYAAHFAFVMYENRLP